MQRTCAHLATEKVADHNILQNVNILINSCSLKDFAKHATMIFTIAQIIKVKDKNSVL